MLSALWGLLFFLLSSTPVVAQFQLPKGLELSAQDSTRLLASNIPALSFPDSLGFASKVRRCIEHLRNFSFLEASADSMVVDTASGTGWAFIHLGPAYYWDMLENGNLGTEEYQYLLVNGGDLSNRPAEAHPPQLISKRMVEWAANQGFPFASARLDNILIKDSTILASWFFDKSKLVRIGKLQVEGNANISTTFLENYLDLRPGSLYNEERLRSVRKKIEELTFLRENRDMVVNFRDDEAIVNLFLAKKASSRFDFLIGLQPRDRAFDLIQPRQLIFTGTLHADLANAFSLGERIKASFEQLRPETQDLKLGFNLPYAFGLQFGADLNMQIYKRDSAWLDVIYDIGVQYLFDGSNYLKVFWNKSATNLLTINEAIIRATKKLPENLDVTNETFGLEYRMRKLDYRLNPRKGWELWVKGGAGERRIRKNSLILALADTSEVFNYESLYDSLNLQSFQFRTRFEASAYIPVFQRSTIKFSLSGGYLFSQEGLFRNELFRIGGNKLLRGFDEETIFSNLFTVLTAEYRLLIGRNDAFFVFADFSYAEKNTVNDFRVDHPIGFGSGLVFETGVGMFGASIAFGRQLNNPIDFTAPKIHFGYINLF